jgi:cytochrome c peroxidase
VCELGTRTPSLRRVVSKWPHFTNGSAKTLTDLLARARFDATRFLHDAAPTEAGLRSLSADEQRDLTAFLELL